ncbi:MAG: hypothetical protein PF487_00725 [Bacteroidales bacterium]|jgi:hypothetical protein|nr:hypothetical protein [Bacteroidales bacterium]
MAKQETNFLEILFRNLLIGMTMYDDIGNAMVIEELNYDPIINHIFIKSGGNSYKMRLDKNYDFEINSNFNKIMPNKEKIYGKRKR